jgi:hypothetical protein
MELDRGMIQCRVRDSPVLQKLLHQPAHHVVVAVTLRPPPMELDRGMIQCRVRDSPVLQKLLHQPAHHVVVAVTVGRDRAVAWPPQNTFRQTERFHGMLRATTGQGRTPPHSFAHPASTWRLKIKSL